MSFNPGSGRRRVRRGHRSLLVGGPLLLAAGATLLAACGGGSSNHSSTATQPAQTAQPSAASARGSGSSPSTSTSKGPTVVTVSSAKFGPILADVKGLALYTATGDTSTQSGCTGPCLQIWPPLLLPAGQAQPIAGPGVTGLGTFMRAEGTQVTYHGKPLYTWFKDTSPGQVTGQGVVDSGGTWFVATVTGASQPAAATPSTAAPPATQAPATRPSTPPATAPGGGVSY
jgi:predicted lipoprotein with Yx(FWY)xxD motif